jgi:hypothetical protein
LVGSSSATASVAASSGFVSAATASYCTSGFVIAVVSLIAGLVQL